MEMKKYNKAVCNGRYQIPHLGHLAMIEEATKIAETTYVVIGSAGAFMSPKQPFSVQERVEMLKLGLRDFGVDLRKIKFVSVHDNRYRNSRWEADMRDAVDEQPDDKIVMVGFDKDKGSWWLDTFGWNVHQVEEYKYNDLTISATNIRNDYFSGKSLYNHPISKSVEMFLIGFKLTDKYNTLKDEHEYNLKELAKMENYPYRDSLNCMTGDAVVVCNGHLLVTIRGNMPGLGAYALPGGHKNSDETTKECAIRELREEVRLKVPERVIRGSIKDQHLFDYPDRSYPICKPTQAILIELLPDNNGKLPKVSPRDEIRDVKWMPLHMVRRNRDKFFDDHYEIIAYFLGL